MIQHRHFFPGYEGPSSNNEGWWHDEQIVHRKYPTAHDHILETREKGEKTSGKRSTTAKQEIQRDPEVVRAMYQLERMN